MVKRDKPRRKYEGHGESLRCCSFLGGDIAVPCRGISAECVFEKRIVSLLGRKTSSGENSL